MKKIYVLIFITGLATGCDDFENHAVKSKVTFLPVVEVIGETEIELACDATGYSDEGAVAFENGNEIDVEVDLFSYFQRSSIDGPDIAEFTYSAANIDGIPGVAFRHVYWPVCGSDLVTSIEGVYTANVIRNGVISAQYQNLGPILIREINDGVYQISDAIGGYYDYGRGYGPHYAARGMIITANDIPSNDFTFGDDVEVGDFGGVLAMKTFTVDPGLKQISFTTDWDDGAFVFEVTLTLED